MWKMNLLRRRMLPLVLLLLICACGGLGETPAMPAASPTSAASVAATTPSPSVSKETPSPTPVLLKDQTARPLVWFAPLDPSPPDASRPFCGCLDFMNLFAEDAPWEQAAQHVHVFKLYGGWVARPASDAQLRQVVAELNRLGMAIAFEAGPLTITEDCGAGIEGFAGLSEGRQIARRIKAAGGVVRYVAFDHPYDAGVLDESPNACHWTPDEVAQNVARYVQMLRTYFPDIIIGDIETAHIDVVEIARWVDAYHAALGEDLGFIHMDLDFSNPNWAERTREIEDFLRERGIAFGLIYFGNWYDRDDRAWLASAGERVKAYEEAAGGQPEHVIFQSWHPLPQHLLPETQADTFTWFINAYFEGRASLGYRREGPGANVAFGASVRASRELPGFGRQNAVDGDLGNWWGAGAFAPQWIELDLGAAYTIADMAFLTSQSPPGETRHDVWVKGPSTGDAYVLLHTFEAETTDNEWLVVPLAAPVEGIRYVRIETKRSPSWISWREIEVISAE
jgi:hypothetical protein